MTSPSQSPAASSLSAATDLSNYTEEQLIEELAKRKMSVNVSFEV